MKSFYVSSKNVVTNDELNEYPAIMPKKIYYGTGDGFVQIKRAYFPFGNNKAKIVYRKDKVGYINKYITNLQAVNYNVQEGYSYIINTNNSEGYIWISQNNSGYINTECDFIYLYPDSHLLFNQHSNINLEKLGFNYVTNIYKLYLYDSFRYSIYGNISKINCLNVINARMGFRYLNITGTPRIMPKATDMHQTYAFCYNLTGSPYCGPLVQQFSEAYYECRSLTGSPVCGNNVIDFSRTYYNCVNLNGELVCGPKVTNLTYTYLNCNKCKYASNLHFYGNNCANAFSYIDRIYGNFYFHNVIGGANFHDTFWASRYNSPFNRLNVHVKSSISSSSSTLINNLFRGITMTLTAITGGSFNLYYNIYIYNDL